MLKSDEEKVYLGVGRQNGRKYEYHFEERIIRLQLKINNETEIFHYFWMSLCDYL